VTQTNWGPAVGGDISHQAVMYDGPDDYLRAVLPFLRDGAREPAPVLAAVPPAAAVLLEAGLDGHREAVSFADITELGRNPGRIISAIWEFIGRNPGRQVRFLGEPFWPARSAAEAREAVRHEALINLAFEAAPVTILCPYDASRLDQRILASAARTHPVVGTARGRRASPHYAGGAVPWDAARPLSPPPARAHRLDYTDSLQPVRNFVDRHAKGFGLDADRGGDLVLAVGELAANTLRHTPGGGTGYAWRTRGEAIFQVTDQGRISDPLVGRRRPAEATGLGLWVVHQICDLVELRTGPAGTTIRTHMRLAGTTGRRRMAR
jgi:anti-sigma regulatory factor (Ser/Thr protein kinase)